MPRETLVMLPGMMCDARLFAPQIDAFKDRYDIVVPSLCGLSSIEGLARRVLSEIAVPRFNLMGLSMGGIVAMQIVGLAPERVSRLALLDTNHLADAPDRFAIRNRQIAEVRGDHLRRVIADEMKPKYLAKANRQNTLILDTLIKMAMELGADCFIQQSIALRDRRDQSENLKGYGGPTLVLCGTEDALCPPSRHVEMAALLRNVQHREVLNAGHIVTLEAPAAISAELRSLLKTSA
jgi:pimeloyl-ACP methyl ester carboxylesterase